MRYLLVLILIFSSVQNAWANPLSHEIEQKVFLDILQKRILFLQEQNNRLHAGLEALKTAEEEADLKNNFVLNLIYELKLFSPVLGMAAVGGSMDYVLGTGLPLFAFILGLITFVYVDVGPHMFLHVKFVPKIEAHFSELDLSLQEHRNSISEKEKSIFGKEAAQLLDKLEVVMSLGVFSEEDASADVDIERLRAASLALNFRDFYISLIDLVLSMRDRYKQNYEQYLENTKRQESSSTGEVLGFIEGRQQQAFSWALLRVNELEIEVLKSLQRSMEALAPHSNSAHFLTSSCQDALLKMFMQPYPNYRVTQ